MNRSEAVRAIAYQLGEYQCVVRHSTALKQYITAFKQLLDMGQVVALVKRYAPKDTQIKVTERKYHQGGKTDQGRPFVHLAGGSPHRAYDVLHEIVHASGVYNHQAQFTEALDKLVRKYVRTLG